MKSCVWLAAAAAWLVSPAVTQDPAAEAFAVLTALPATPAVPGGVRVTVRDAEGRPAANANVVFLATEPGDPTATAQARQRSGSDEPLLLASLVATGTRFAVDERGIARVPAHSGRLLAWHGDHFAAALATVQPGHTLPHVTLQLLPVLTFQVVLVDANDQPADDVSIAITAPLVAASPRARTDARGRVTFRLVGKRPDEARVRVQIATNAPIDAPLPATGTELRLKLPPCGSLRTTYSGPVLPGTLPKFRLSVDRHTIEPDVVDAEGALFRRVAVGFTGEATAAIDAFTATTKDLPIAPATEAKVTLARAPDASSLVVRLLDADGAPLRNTRVAARILADRRSRGFSRTTNTEGWVEIELHGDAGDDRTVRLIPSRSEGPLGQLELAVGKDDKGRIDRGERRITASTVALAGCAVNEAGKPVAGLGLSISGTIGGYVVTDAAGMFVIRTIGEKPPSLTVGLHSQAWYFVAPVEHERVFSTADEARLVLRSAGRLRFGASGLPSRFLCDFSVRLEPADGESKAIELDDFLDGGDELLLPPGHWHFLVTEGGQELHRIENVRIDAAIENHDARFLDFDWRAFAAVATIKTLDADGKPTDACTVWHDSGGQGTGATPKGGISHWLVPKNGGKIRVQANDSTRKEVDIGVVTGEHTVRIETP